MEPMREQGFDPPDPAPGTEEQVVAKDERQRLREAIARLPDDQREALILTQLEKIPYEEVAQSLGISEGTAWMNCCCAGRKAAIPTRSGS